MFVGPGSERTCKARQMGDRPSERQLGQKSLADSSKTTHKVSELALAAGTTMFEQGTLKQNKEGKESIHFNVETVSMNCKPSEAVKHLCIFLAVMKYMDHLAGEDPDRSTGEQHCTGETNTS